MWPSNSSRNFARDPSSFYPTLSPSQSRDHTLACPGKYPLRFTFQRSACRYVPETILSTLFFSALFLYERLVNAIVLVDEDLREYNETSDVVISRIIREFVIKKYVLRAVFSKSWFIRGFVNGKWKRGRCENCQGNWTPETSLSPFEDSWDSSRILGDLK